ncbi:hypothetical protein [Saccharibacillus sp. JS10]|uniref:hypothetical protein n=1 Tax=Saccharibacillus sp. JS10 TaxID=2950552 RepID=UPI00210D315C|nr:hypothetical protein [Saccharibacillus sp. JS10]MCQ4086560.1 hypothetical protein [Saccharibacillus sp. JS10]
MPIMPIDSTNNIARIDPVQRVQRAQSAALRFKLPGEEQRLIRTKERKPSPGKRIVVRENGWVREYALLPDGTRILLHEEVDHSMTKLSLPHAAPPMFSTMAEPDVHDPENSMKSSGRKLQSLLDQSASDA